MRDGVDSRTLSPPQGCFYSLASPTLVESDDAGVFVAVAHIRDDWVPVVVVHILVGHDVEMRIETAASRVAYPTNELSHVHAHSGPDTVPDAVEVGVPYGDVAGLVIDDDVVAVAIRPTRLDDLAVDTCDDRAVERIAGLHVAHVARVVVRAGVRHALAAADIDPASCCAIAVDAGVLTP